jgi:hypothetical protein
MLILFTLLAGFVPLLQVAFFALLEDLYPGRLAVKDRDKTPRITGVILITSAGRAAMSASQLEMPCTPMNIQISPSHV